MAVRRDSSRRWGGISRVSVILVRARSAWRFLASRAASRASTSLIRALGDGFDQSKGPLRVDHSQCPRDRAAHKSLPEACRVDAELSDLACGGVIVEEAVLGSAEVEHFIETLGDPRLEQTVRMRLEGYTIREIAASPGGGTSARSSAGSGVFGPHGASGLRSGDGLTPHPDRTKVKTRRSSRPLGSAFFVYQYRARQEPCLGACGALRRWAQADPSMQKPPARGFHDEERDEATEVQMRLLKVIPCVLLTLACNTALAQMSIPCSDPLTPEIHYGSNVTYSLLGSPVGGGSIIDVQWQYEMTSPCLGNWSTIYDTGPDTFVVFTEGTAGTFTVLANVTVQQGFGRIVIPVQGVVAVHRCCVLEMNCIK